MKRRAFKLMLFLLAGTIINVAVAWGCVSYLNPQSFQVIGSVVPMGPGRTQDNILTYTRTGHRQVEREFAMDMLAEGTIPDRPMSPRLEVLSGWPLFGMECFGFISAPRGGGRLDTFILTEDVFQADAFRWGIPWKSRFYRLSDLDGPMCKALPLRPIWPGFVINTIFYAAVVWMLFAVPGAVRRRVRITRGQCARCAYPVGDSAVCTECGAQPRKLQIQQ